MRYATQRNWRFAGIAGGVVGGILLALYPIAIYPYFHSAEWKEVQEQTRKGIVQEDIQPGSMKVWTDPFGRKKN